MKRVSNWEKTARPYLLIAAGTALMSIATVTIYDPIGLETGGFTGLAILIKAASAGWVEGGVPLWLSNLVLNVPMYGLALAVLGRRFIGRTLYGTVMLSLWMYLIPPMDLVQGDLLLGALFGGAFSGAGMGLVFRANATTGGTDMAAALLHHRFRHYSVAKLVQILDGAIVLAGLCVFSVRQTMHAVIAIYVTEKASVAVLEGMRYSKAAYIITDSFREVADRIMRELDRGVTGISARGMFTDRDKCVLYCVVSPRQIVGIKDIVKSVDPRAFVIVSDVREVLGEGFQEYAEELQ